MRTFKLLGRNSLFHAGFHCCNSVSLCVLYVFEFFSCWNLFCLEEYKYVDVHCLNTAVSDLTCQSMLMALFIYFYDVTCSYHTWNCFADHQKYYFEYCLQRQHQKECFFPCKFCGFFPTVEMLLSVFNFWSVCVSSTTHLCALFEHSSFNFHTDPSENAKSQYRLFVGGFSPLKLSPVILNKSRNKKLGLLWCFYHLHFERTSWWRSILLHGRENAVNFMLNYKKGFFVIAGTHDSQQSTE